MESTLGDVKPLISEAPQHEEFVTPTMDMLSNGDAYSSSDGTRSWKTINSKTSLSGNEYKFTLAEGMYKSLEIISIGFWLDVKLKLQEKVLSTDITKSDNVTHADVLAQSEGDRYIKFRFNMPKTQNEFKEKSPYIAYIDVPCENVRGGKLRFSAEVPSSSEIFEKSLPTPDEPVEIPVKPTINITPDYTGKEDGVFCVDNNDNKIPCKNDRTDKVRYCTSQQGLIIPCKNDGTDRISGDQSFDEVEVTIKRPFEFTLKMSDKNNFVIYKYYPQTGNILGYGVSNEKPLIVYQIEKDLTEDKVRRWFKRNGVKIEKF